MSDITFEPAKFYDASVVCITEGCPNHGRALDVRELYSNAGTPIVECGLCQHSMEIVSAVPIDPQPEMA